MPFLGLFHYAPRMKDATHERGKGEGGGSQKELGKGPGVVDLQRCWGSPEQSYQGRI